MQSFVDGVNQHVLKLIRELNPQYWFIENPRGGLRKMRFMKDLPRYTLTYCQYGDTRMKPTDIFTNHPNPVLSLRVIMVIHVMLLLHVEQRQEH